MKKMKTLLLAGLALLLTAFVITTSGCSDTQTINASLPSGDPFTTVWGPQGQQIVIFSGNTAGHRAGAASEFELKLNNTMKSDNWQGSWRLALLDNNGIVNQLENGNFNVPAGLETSQIIRVTFEEGLSGAYGLALEIENRGQSVQTIWIGEKGTSAGPWPIVQLFPEASVDEQYFKIAHNFVLNSPTFIFDGMEESLEFIGSDYLSDTGAWQYVFSFESRHAGYGDRTGDMLAQVMAPHEVVIIVKDGQVTKAVMDSDWDMLSQSHLIKEISQQQSMINAAERFVLGSPTFRFDGIEETLRIGEVKTPALEPEWTIVITFDSRHAGYGDRTGDMLAQVITHHEAVITVNKGIVTEAIMDGRWDMLKQELLP